MTLARGVIRDDERLVGFGFGDHANKLFDIRARRLHPPPAFEVRPPLRRLREGFLRVFIQRLGHQRNQIADHARVIEQRFDNRMGQFALLVSCHW